MPGGCGREREPKSECDSLGVRLAGRRALKAQYVVDEEHPLELYVLGANRGAGRATVAIHNHP